MRTQRKRKKGIGVQKAAGGQKHGYREIFALEKYPYTGKRHYYTKELL